MRSIALITLASVLAGCSAAATDQQVVRTPKAETKLAEALRGKTAGAPVTCLQPGVSYHTNVIDDHTILFENGGRTIYRQDPAGGCAPLGTGFYALVTKTSQSSTCQGDIATVLDTQTGMTVGSCAMGPFVPYR